MSRSMKQEQKFEPIDLITILLDFFKIFIKMWPHVLILTILFGAVFGVRSYNSYCAYYTASATFTINIRQEQSDGSGSDSSFFDNAAAEQMAKTFPYILTSGVLQRKVAQSMDVSSVRGSIRAFVAPNTNLLTLSVTDTDAELAYETLEAVIQNYPSISEGIVGKINMELLDETGVPQKPDNGRSYRGSIIKGAMLGCFMGLLWVAVVVASRKTIRREEDCVRLVNSRCLGIVPYVRAKKRSSKKEQAVNILQNGIPAKFEEAYRIIRNKVEHSARAHKIQVILITSAMAGEGKSTSAVNLALSLAREGSKVALVDCDLRHPSDSAILGVKNSVGLSECLKGKASVNDCLMVPKDLPIEKGMRLVFLPGGTAIGDASGFLGSERMRRIIEGLKQQVDYVILDTAPVGMLTDAGILAQYAQGAVFVIRKDFARADHILEGMEHLADSKVHLMGCIINGGEA